MQKNESKVEKQNIGNAGEYFIASYLSSKDFTVTLTLGRAEKYDLLCVTPDDQRTIKISVKSKLTGKPSFTLSEKDEKFHSEDFYYAFVLLNAYEALPDFWIIPSAKVNEVLSSASKKYYASHIKKNGEKPNDSKIRKLDLVDAGNNNYLYPEDWFEQVEMYHSNYTQLSDGL